MKFQTFLSQVPAQSCLTLCDPMDCISARLLCPWDSLGKNTEVVCHLLLHFPFYGWIIKGYTTLFLSIHQLMGIGIVHLFGYYE